MHLAEGGVVTEVRRKRADHEIRPGCRERDRLHPIQQRCRGESPRVISPVHTIQWIVDDGGETRWGIGKRDRHRQADVIDIRSGTIHAQDVEPRDGKCNRASCLYLCLERLLMVVVGRVRGRSRDPVNWRLEISPPFPEGHRIVRLWSADFILVASCWAMSVGAATTPLASTDATKFRRLIRHLEEIALTSEGSAGVARTRSVPDVIRVNDANGCDCSNGRPRTTYGAGKSLQSAKKVRTGNGRHRAFRIDRPGRDVTFWPDATLLPMQMVSGAMLARWNGLPDEQVVLQVLDGQTALFEVLMRRHNERLYRAARAILRDDREAEDVMQQAYVNAYAHLRQFDGRASFATWLTRIAVHESLARVRRRKRSTCWTPMPRRRRRAR